MSWSVQNIQTFEWHPNVFKHIQKHWMNWSIQKYSNLWMPFNIFKNIQKLWMTCDIQTIHNIQKYRMSWLFKKKTYYFLNEFGPLGSCQLFIDILAHIFRCGYLPCRLFGMWARNAPSARLTWRWAHEAFGWYTWFAEYARHSFERRSMTHHPLSRGSTITEACPRDAAMKPY